MIGLIMAGGYATRLWPITRSIAKPLLPLGEYRIIDRIVLGMREIQQIDSIYVTTNAYYERQFRDWIEENNYDIELIVEGTMREEEKLGTIRAMHRAMKSIGEDDCLVVGGDNVLSLSFKSLINFYRENQAPTLAVYEIDRLEDVSKYGEVTVSEDNKVLAMREKPKDPKSKLISTACYIFPKNTLKLLDQYIKEENKLDSPGYFLEWLYKRTPVYAYPFKGYWFDIGTPRGYIEAFITVNKGTQKGKNVKLKNSSLEGSTYIGENTSLTNTEVENSLIWHNSSIEDSVIHNSIILTNVQVKNARIEWCIIADNVEVNGVNLRNSVIGEYSKISI